MQEAGPCDTCCPPRLPVVEFMKLHWVPDPTPRGDDNSKFLHFEDLYGKETEEIFRPTMSNISRRINKSLLAREKARGVISCKDCLKPRVIYGDKKLWKIEENVISRHTETIFYRCGVPIFAEDHPLSEKVVTRCMLKCSDPVELLYFSTKKIRLVFVIGVVQRKKCATNQPIAGNNIGISTRYVNSAKTVTEFFVQRPILAKKRKLAK